MTACKPPTPFYGGKQRIAAEIVSHFPPHQHYVEPYCGGLSVLLAKPPSRIETINDLDHHLITFWRVLRNQPEDLMRVCALTPHSRAELDLCREPMDGLDDLEIARRVWSQLVQGRSGRRTRTGWRFYINADRSTGLAGYIRGYVGRMPAAAARLADVQLECRPALEVIDAYGQNPSALLYVDPPYLASTRRSLQYVHEMHTTAEHAELAEALTQTRAAVVLSGYDSPEYRHWYQDWDRVEIPASTQQAGHHSPRTEVLWINRQIANPVLDLDGGAA